MAKSKHRKLKCFFCKKKVKRAVYESVWSSKANKFVISCPLCKDKGGKVPRRTEINLFQKLDNNKLKNTLGL